MSHTNGNGFSALSRRRLLQVSAAAAGISILPWRECRADVRDHPQPTATDWPWWRGPDYNAHASGEVPPLKWSETKNVLWKTPLPGRGHATPTIWGERIFLATADDDRQTQSLICLDRDTGRKRWQTQLHIGGFEKKHRKNTHASATPASDGWRVFTVFYRDGVVWASAVDFEGKRKWQQKVGAYNERFGYGSSPTICGRLLLVAGESKADGFLVALDRESGEEVWRASRPKMASYGPPVVATLAGRQQILLQGNTVAGYDPQTGRELWHCQAPAKATACALAFDDQHVYASGGYPEQRLYCIAADGRGDVTDSHIRWKHERKSRVAYVPSPLLAADRLYLIDDGGFATCFRTSDGEPLWVERLGKDFSASPTLIGDYVFAANEIGETFIFKAADKFELVAKNNLPEGIFASPVICGGRLYLRTTGHLYCIGA